MAEVFGYHAAVVFGIRAQQAGGLGGFLVAEDAAAEVNRVVYEVAGVVRSGFQAMSRKNVMGYSIGLRSPTLTIHSSRTPYS